MYRLIKFSNSRSNQHLLTTSVRSIETLNNLCFACQKYRNDLLYKASFRYQSTSRHLLLQTITKKKKIRRPRKFAEILEVTSKCTTETKASVTNLNAKHLAMLTKTKFDIKLDELHKVKNPQNQISQYSSCTNENSAKNSNIPEKIQLNFNSKIDNSLCDGEEFRSELLNDHLDSFSTTKLANSELLDDPEVQNGLIDELVRTDVEHFDDSHVDDSAKSNVAVNKGSNKKELTKSSKRKKNAEIATEHLAKLHQLDKRAKQESLARILLAYCGLCVAHDKPNRGLQAVYFYLNRAKRNNNMPSVENVKIYNCLLEGFAARANYSKVGEVLSIMKKESIKADVQTFVAIFECLGRLPEENSMKLLDGYHKEILARGFQLNDLMADGKFINDRREVVLKAIRRLKPDFTPVYTKPNIQYTCNLLKSLNNPDQDTILNDPSCLNFAEQTDEKIYLNSNINQLDHNNLFNDIKNKTNREIKNVQLQANLLNILKKYSIQLQNTVDTNSFCNTTVNTYHSLSTNISIFTESQYLNHLKLVNPKMVFDVKKSTNIENKVLKMAPQSLKIVEERSNSLFTAHELKERAKRQMLIETAGFILVDSVEKQTEPTEIVTHFRSKLTETQAHWEKVIKSCIKRDLASLQAQTQASGGAQGSPSLHACLHALPIDELTQIVLQEVRKLAEGSETYSPTLSQLYRELGQIVHSRYQVKVKKQTGILDKVDRIYEKYCDWYANYYTANTNERAERIFNPRHYWQALSYNDQDGPSIDIEDNVWPHTMIGAVGKFLYSIITKDLKIDVNSVKLKSKQSKLLPAFYTLFRNQGHVVKEEIKAHPVVTRLFRGAAMPQIAFHASTLPMYCPPRPWARFNTGGYLVMNTEMLRLPRQATQQIERVTNTSIQDLYPSFDSLNQLAAVPWTVNEEILDVVLEIFCNGGNARLGVAPPADTYPNPPAVSPNATKSERFQAFRQRMIARRRKAEMYSLWCDALYRLSLANHFRKQIFWLPHNMDFRGRVYPVPPHLTHLGADLARSLLIFAEEKPLGPDGLKWLKLHLINLLGTKKRNSIPERLQYADKMIDNILDSADNPLKGRMWWTESEEPWQTLACCKEIANAVRSSDPAMYKTRFPVHQDGSCNGLQHYAALGRDAAGAKSVNLTPSEYPQDVYSDVAVLVEQQRKCDAQNGVKIAEILDGYVRRKVIKQTVMTTVYGVTRFGARLQIAKQLKDIDDFPKDYVWQASSYLTGKTFESLRTMFTSTKEIQDWLTECARFISGMCQQNVEWVTPLGLPIVQPYSRYRKIEHTTAKNKIAEHYAMDMFERPNVMKQKNAFPPNFIHSLDSSHMMLTSINCERAGITFVSVHDCFWTHPSTVHIMNKICREQFVSLHKEQILENLSEFLCDKYLTSDDESRTAMNNATKVALRKLLQKLPQTGDFNLDSVLQSIYFFS